MSAALQTLTALLFIAYHVMLVRSFGQYAAPRRGYWFTFGISIAINAALILFSRGSGAPAFTLSCLLLLFVMAELQCLYDMAARIILYAGGLYVFCLIGCLGTVSALASVITGQSATPAPTYDRIIVSVSLLAAILLIQHVCLWRTSIFPGRQSPLRRNRPVAAGFLPVRIARIFFRHRMLSEKAATPHEKMGRLLHTPGSLTAVSVCQLLLAAYMLLLSAERYMSGDRFWFSMLRFISFLMCFIVWGGLMNRALRLNDISEYKTLTKTLEEQLERQIRHYQSHRQSIDSYRKFRHDYENVMKSVKSLLARNEVDKAVSLIDGMRDFMGKEVSNYRTYAGNVFIDALLQDTAEVCAQQGILFSASLPIPDGSVLSDLNVVRVAANLMQNAVEACRACQDGAKRFIEVSGSANDDWTYIQIKNSYGGKLKIKDGRIATIKQDKAFHGFGLQIVREIIEDAGGMVLIDVDQKNRIFTVKLHVPRR